MSYRHPSRYPKHPGDKGQVHGGECNRTACSSVGARHFNRATFGYYCAADAAAIDYDPRAPRICVPVDHQLDAVEVAAHDRAMLEETAARRA